MFLSVRDGEMAGRGGCVCGHPGGWDRSPSPSPRGGRGVAGAAGMEVSRGLPGTDLLAESSWTVWGLASGGVSSQRGIRPSRGQPNLVWPRQAACPGRGGTSVSFRHDDLLAPSQPARLEAAPPAGSRLVMPATLAATPALLLVFLAPLTITCYLVIFRRCPSLYPPTPTARMLSPRGQGFLSLLFHCCVPTAWKSAWHFVGVL